MAWLKRKDTEPETPLHQLSEEDFLTLSRISATMDALPLGVIVMSSDGSNMWSNSAADSLLHRNQTITCCLLRALKDC